MGTRLSTRPVSHRRLAGVDGMTVSQYKSQREYEDSTTMMLRCNSIWNPIDAEVAISKGNGGNGKTKEFKLLAFLSPTGQRPGRVAANVLPAAQTLPPGQVMPTGGNPGDDPSPTHPPLNLVDQ